MTNPLLDDWDTAYGMPPFDRIRDEDIPPAFDEALHQARENIFAIEMDAEPPSFANTVEALELADERLNRVLAPFWTLVSTEANATREGMQRDFSPRLAQFSSEVARNRALFDRIERLWERRDEPGLTPEQERVLYLTRRGFVRSGAKLEGEAADRLAAVKERLAVLGTQFAQNLLADERSWTMPLAEADLAGLPDFVVQAARAAGEEKGADGPVVTLSRSLIVPFLQFSPDRAARRRAYAAWVSRGANGGDTDNRGIAAEILALRQERAELLGYESFAAYKLETEMAKTPEAVRELLMRVWEPARKAAEADAAVLERMLHEDGVEGRLEPWDWRYYAEKRRQAEHDLDEEKLKPFLGLDRMIEAAFACANRLFGLEFREAEAPVWHPDVRVWEVTRDGRHMALFCGDYFNRSGKRSGAWCTTIRQQRKLNGEQRPIVLNVCNFAKPPQGRPALLSYDDARTLFHEFGHALHQMLSDVTYESISGTSVARDFVELPSQLYEHWLEVPEVLAEFARHAETGEPMPEEMRDRLLGARIFDMGFQTVEYVASALVDLAFHEGAAPSDPMQRQADVLDQIGMPHAIRMRHATPHFAHVFASDGYSAGYYSYMWSEVMDADAFQAFEEAGDHFDPETARKLEEHVLSAGGTAEADELYGRFRGRMPGVEALLKGRGLIGSMTPPPGPV